MKQELVDVETQIAALNLLDVQGIDWERVQRTAYLIHQHFRYDYPGPVRELQQRLLIVPPDVYGDQKCIMHRLDVSAHVAETTGEVDKFGNTVVMLSIPLIERSIDFEAWIVVERFADHGPHFLPGDVLTGSSYREPSVLTLPDEALRRVAAMLLEGEQVSMTGFITRSATSMAQPVSIRRLPRRSRWGAGCVRIMPISCWRSAGSADCLRAMSLVTCWAREAHMPGSRSWFPLLSCPAKRWRWRLTRRMAARPICTILPSRLGEIITMSPRPRGRFKRPTRVSSRRASGSGRFRWSMPVAIKRSGSSRMVTFDLGVYERLCWEILSGHHAAKRDRKRAKGDRGRLGQGESPRVVRCSI